MYRIYYTHEGEITIVGASDQPGEYIECDLKTLEKIQASPHLYRIENKKLLKKQLNTKKEKSFAIQIVFLDGFVSRTTYSTYWLMLPINQNGLMKENILG